MKPSFCVRNAAADTFAMVVFSFIVGMIIEIFISGMSFDRSLASRIVAIPVNVITAYPYGMYRDFIISLISKRTQSKLLKRIADTFSYVSFQSPVYALILVAVGADFQQIITAVLSNAVISCCIGFIYGQFLDICRKLFKVPGYTLNIEA